MVAGFKAWLDASRWGLGMLYALALVVGVIAGRAEYLNAAAGYYLPRTNPMDDGTWRTGYLDETRWRTSFEPRDDSGAPFTRDLTADERRHMQEDISRMDANARLRDWIESAGLTQRLLLPGLVIATLFATSRPGRRLMTLAPIAIVILLAGASLVYRGDFSSLEW